MPDLGNGTYALPNPPFASGDVARSAPLNGNFADIEAALNARLRSALVSPFALTLLDDASAAAARTTLEVRRDNSATARLLGRTSAGAGPLEELDPAAVLALLGVSLAALVPAGAVMHFAMAAPPAGWLRANGAAVSRTTHAALFAAIGTTYGAGDGSTTFNLPDLRGEFVRGWDDGRGVDAGRAIGSAQGQAIQSHDHGGGLTGPTDTFGYAGGANVFLRAVRGQTDAAGGAETRPRNVALLACIKT